MPKVNIAAKLAEHVGDPAPAVEDTPSASDLHAGSDRLRPKYLQLERKDLRVRRDQADDLTVLTRRLNRARAHTGERITDNTLIRVAIDVLLRDADSLHGTTETELLHSATTNHR